MGKMRVYFELVLYQSVLQIPLSQFGLRVVYCHGEVGRDSAGRIIHRGGHEAGRAT